MSKKNQAIEVQATEEERVIDNNSVTITKLSIGKKILGFIIPDNKRFYVEIDGKKESGIKTLNEGIQYLLAKYNLQK
ncbi:MAG: DUF2969 domain-containing protein [Lactobacillales bacterium]|jgi:hypothetical protein|nr:DUF2969 domain-containing protein [Lactobacillales bacterium]